MRAPRPRGSVGGRASAGEAIDKLRSEILDDLVIPTEPTRPETATDMDKRHIDELSKVENKRRVLAADVNRTPQEKAIADAHLRVEIQDLKLRFLQDVTAVKAQAMLYNLWSVDVIKQQRQQKKVETTNKGIRSEIQALQRHGDARSAPFVPQVFRNTNAAHVCIHEVMAGLHKTRESAQDKVFVSLFMGHMWKTAHVAGPPEADGRCFPLPVPMRPGGCPSGRKGSVVYEDTAGNRILITVSEGEEGEVVRVFIEEKNADAADFDTVVDPSNEWRASTLTVSDAMAAYKAVKKHNCGRKRTAHSSQVVESSGEEGGDEGQEDAEEHHSDTCGGSGDLECSDNRWVWVTKEWRWWDRMTGAWWDGGDWEEEAVSVEVRKKDVKKPDRSGKVLLALNLCDHAHTCHTRTNPSPSLPHRKERLRRRT